MAASVTLSDVAREAGVSLATASRAINGSANRTVRADLRDRVLDAAARLRYTPDANAQAMARGRTTSLGLVVHDIADPYFSSIAAGVTRAADRAGLQVTLASTQHDPSRESGLVDLLKRQRARAIVIAGGRLDDEATNDELRAALADYRAVGGSVALIGQPILGVDSVVVDNAQGAGDLAKALHGRGYRRFAVLAGPADHLTARERSESFRGALAELGSPVPDDAVITSAFTHEGGEDAMRTLLRRDDLPELVFAVNDVMALGALAAGREAGIRVPEDLALAGFDDISTLRDVVPALTTVRIPLVDVGIAATELALADASDEPRLTHVPTQVVPAGLDARPLAVQDDDLATVVDRERLLLDPAVRADRDRVESLLHPDVVEHGASGRAWTRSQIIAALADDPAVTGHATGFVAVRLSADVVLVTYRVDGPRASLRSSVWVEVPGAGWQLRFHQGTPTD